MLLRYSLSPLPAITYIYAWLIYTYVPLLTSQSLTLIDVSLVINTIFKWCILQTCFGITIQFGRQGIYILLWIDCESKDRKHLLQKTISSKRQFPFFNNHALYYIYFIHLQNKPQCSRLHFVLKWWSVNHFSYGSELNIKMIEMSFYPKPASLHQLENVISNRLIKILNYSVDEWIVNSDSRHSSTI